MRRPVVTLVAAVAILLALCIPVLDLKLGFVGVRALPDRFESKQGFVAFEESFGAGTTDSTEIVVDGDVSSPSVRAAIRRLEARLRSDDAFLPPETTPVPRSNSSPASRRCSGATADERVPTTRCGGSGASMSPSRCRSRRRAGARPRRDGRGHRLLRPDGEVDADRLCVRARAQLHSADGRLPLDRRCPGDPPEPPLGRGGLRTDGACLRGRHRQRALRLPAGRRDRGVGALFLFAVLFGLSMDYHVFLLSRIREIYTRTGDNTESVAHGVASTARMITGAALIIVAVFCGFAVGDTLAFQQMGFGVAVALSSTRRSCARSCCRPA